MTFGPANRARIEAADTDVPPTGDQPRALPDFGPTPRISDERDFEAEAAGPLPGVRKSRRELTGGWSEVSQEDYTWLVDPDGNHHILIAPGMYKVFNGFTPSKRRAQIINNYNKEKGLPNLPENPQFFLRGVPALGGRDRVIPGSTPGTVPYVPAEGSKDRQELSGGWVRETGGGEDHLISPSGQRWDLNQKFLEGDNPNKVMNRIRRQFFLEDGGPELYRGTGDDDTTKLAARGMFEASTNDLNFERHEPEKLEGEDFPPNAEQQEVSDAVEAGKHTIVNAKAGTGKTTVLALAARRIKRSAPAKRIGYIVFNKSVQVEGEERMPDNVEVRTSHSLGWRFSPTFMTGRFKKGLKKNSEIASHLNMDNIGDDSKVSVARKVKNAVGKYVNSADDRR